MSIDQIDELYGKGSLGKIKQYHKDASAVSTDSHDAKSYHDTSVRRTETLGKREKAKTDIAKAKKGSTREKGWRSYLQSKDDSARQRQSSQDSRNRLSPKEKTIHNTYLKAKGVQEDAPTVNSGSGNIAGIGVGPKGEPGVAPKFQPKKTKSVSNGLWKEQTEKRRELLKRYIIKASDSRAKAQSDAKFYEKKNHKKYGKAFRKVINRRAGIIKAVSKLEESNPVIGDMLRRKGQFAGAAVFEVNSKLFHNLTMQKRKGKHWRTYLEEDDCYAEIREWAAKNPKGKIVVRNESTGEMRYIKY
jgi:hypothetical protein